MPRGGAPERGSGPDERSKARPRVATARKRGREPRLSTVPRARGVVAATSGMLGISSTRRAAILAVVVCALALTVAVPLRNYVAQRQELAAVTAQQQALAGEVEALTRQRETLSDPAEVAAQARSRLGYVAPGEVPYVVQLPPAPGPADAGIAEPGVAWYRSLWREVVEGPQ